jgi:hypothetical protein
MADVFSKRKRSQIMAAVRSKGNKTTELKLISIFRVNGIVGWRRNKKITGSPDFVFRKKRIALFVDGCFWHGSIPAQFFEDFPWLGKFKPAQVVEYCRIRQGNRIARTRLIIQARGDRLCPKGTYSKIGSGETKLVEEKFVLNEAAKSKSIKHYHLPQFIFEAAKQNNVRFFIRLGKALQTREKVPDVDWTRCDPVACFLVENWCEWRAYKSRFPVLCFFSDFALADFCSAMFGRKSGNPSVYSIRQWRRRLGLKQASRPKIREISLKGNKVLFVGC